MTLLLFLRWAIKASLWMHVKSPFPCCFQGLGKWRRVTTLLRFTPFEPCFRCKLAKQSHMDRNVNSLAGVFPPKVRGPLIQATPDSVTSIAQESAGVCATRWLARKHGLDGEPCLLRPGRR